MTDFTPWIRPTLKGPFLTVWGFTTLAHLTFGVSVLSGGRFDGWMLGMLFGSFFAATCVAALIFADLVLLRMKARKLPTGGAAWLSAMLAPIAIWMGWAWLGMGDGENVPEIVLRIAGPVLVGPLALRLVLGSAP